MPNRTKGNNFEYRVKKYLEKQGWTVIRRGRSGFPDLHCFRKIEGHNCFEILEVECKNHERYPKNIIDVISDEDKENAEKIMLSGRKFMLAINCKEGKKRGEIRLIKQNNKKSLW